MKGFDRERFGGDLELEFWDDSPLWFGTSLGQAWPALMVLNFLEGPNRGAFWFTVLIVLILRWTWWGLTGEIEDFFLLKY